jgi:enoyl-CoA hydratase
VSITVTTDGDDLIVVTLDDGKVNAFDVPFFTRLEEALDEHADRALVIAGREGMLSAGLNVKTMATLDDDGLTALLMAFGRTMHRIWLEPRPVAVAATGHAIAGGTILAMCADHAVAAEGQFGWGLTETTIGFPLPQWIIAIARANVRADRLEDLLLPGSTVSPAAAVAVGFADVAVQPAAVVDTAISKARELARLPRSTYAETKRRLRGPASAASLADLEADTRAALAARG